MLEIARYLALAALAQAVPWQALARMRRGTGRRGGVVATAIRPAANPGIARCPVFSFAADGAWTGCRGSDFFGYAGGPTAVAVLPALAVADLDLVPRGRPA